VIDAGAIRRLQAMEVPVWHLRGSKSPAADAATSSRRIRLEAGSGRWLLVVDDARRACNAALLEDIRATLGGNECRFGTWSDSADAGIAVSDCPGHGIDHVLVFDGDADACDGLVHAEPLDVLGTSGRARRALWQRLGPLLEA